MKLSAGGAGRHPSTERTMSPCRHDQPSGTGRRPALPRPVGVRFAQPAKRADDLDDLVLEEAPRLAERGRVQVDVRAVSAAHVLGDAEQLARTSRNLTSNTERHATRTVPLELRGKRRAQPARRRRLRAGIPARHHATVFKPFTRLDEARSRDAGGSGLGLAIVHDIVERHMGTVTIASSDGEGARSSSRCPGPTDPLRTIRGA